MEVGSLSVASSVSLAAFGAGLGLVTGIFKELWIKRRETLKDRALFVSALRNISNGLSLFSISKSDYNLTGLRASGIWHIERIRMMLVEAQEFLSDAKSTIDIVDFQDIHAFWTAKKAISEGMSCLDIQQAGLEQGIKGAEDELWSLFESTMEAIIAGVVGGFDMAIAQLQNDRRVAPTPA